MSVDAHRWWLRVGYCSGGHRVTVLFVGLERWLLVDDKGSSYGIETQTLVLQWLFTVCAPIHGLKEEAHKEKKDAS